MASVGPAALPRSAGSSASSLPFVNALSCYLHGSIAREDSERLLLAQKPVVDGRFLLRIRTTDSRQYRVRVTSDGRLAVLMRVQQSSKDLQQAFLPDAQHSSMGSGRPGEPDRRASMASQGRRGSMESISAVHGGSVASVASVGDYGLDSASSRQRLPSMVDNNFQLGVKDSLTRAARSAAAKSISGDDAWMGTVRTATDAGGNGSATSSIAAVSSSYYTVDAESAEAPDQYVLSVIYQGRVTHHLLKREAFGACFSINKMGTEARSLRDVIQFLARPSGPWPVELKEPVPPLEDALELQLEGRMLLSKGDYPEALHAFNKSLASLDRMATLFARSGMQTDHEKALAYDLRCSTYFAKGDFVQAVDDAVRASELEPEWFKPHMMRGMALAAANRHSEAISAYEQAALLIPPSHIRASQCERVIADLKAEVERGRQQESKAATALVQHQRARTRRALQRTPSMRLSSAIVFKEEFPDEAVWYCVTRAGLCGENRTGLQAAQHRFFGRAADEEPLPMGGLQPFRPHGLDRERNILEELAAQHCLPSGRLRLSQRQLVSSWSQWFLLRMMQNVADSPAPCHQQTSELFSWVLTAINTLQARLGPDLRENITLHVVSDSPMNGYSSVEFCALCPTVTQLTIVEILPGPTSVLLSIDGILPAGDVEQPAQRLTHVVCYGDYSDLVERAPEVMANADLIMFLNCQLGANTEVDASREDALHLLKKRNVPCLLTQSQGQVHEAMRQWLAKLMLPVVAEHTGVNPFAALQAVSSNNDVYGTAQAPDSDDSRAESPAFAYVKMVDGRPQEAASAATKTAVSHEGEEESPYVDMSKDMSAAARAKLAALAASHQPPAHQKELVDRHVDNCANGYTIMVAR